MAKTKQEIAKQGIEEYIKVWEKSGGVYDLKRAPILAARKIDHAGKVYDVILIRFNSDEKEKFIFSVITRERGTITGGYETRFMNDERAARAEYMRVDHTVL